MSKMRVFTEDDVQTRINSITNEPLAYINGLVPDNLVDKPLAWQLKGLQQTSTGYGSKLTSRYMIMFEGRLRRLYVTCFSNSSTHWFMLRGIKVIVS